MLLLMKLLAVYDKQLEQIDNVNMGACSMCPIYPFFSAFYLKVCSIVAACVLLVTINYSEHLTAGLLLLILPQLRHKGSR